MMEDLPTLGYPIKPTEICLRSEKSEENCLKSWMREPFPKELLIEAWKAMVGWNLDRYLTHRDLRGSQSRKGQDPDLVKVLDEERYVNETHSPLTATQPGTRSTLLRI